MGSAAIIDQLEAGTIIADKLPEFRVGDTVRVHVRIVEGQRERVQAFEGVVIKRKRGGNRATFTVRKVSYGVGVERVFPANSPRVDKVDVLQRGRVRRNRLYYLRSLSGKAARIRARIQPGKKSKGGKGGKGTKGAKRAPAAAQ